MMPLKVQQLRVAIQGRDCLTGWSDAGFEVRLGKEGVGIKPQEGFDCGRGWASFHSMSCFS